MAREDGPVAGYRIDLEAVTVDDAPALFDALDQPEVGTYIGGPYADSSEGMAVLIARWMSGPPTDRPGETWRNFVVRLADGTVIGHAQATVHDDWAEVAWVLGSAWWGQGYGSEAAEVLLQHVASIDGIQRVWATVHPDNLRCKALLARLAFVTAHIDDAPELGSYDPGDDVYMRWVGATPQAASSRLPTATPSTAVRRTSPT